MKLFYTLILSLAFTSVFSQLNVTFRSKLAFPGNELANIWGYADSSGNEYALVGISSGLAIVDVTNPDSIVHLFTVPGALSNWREVKTWQQYAYVTTEGGGGLTIVDLSQLPDTVQYKNWTGNNEIEGLLDAIHALHIDNGYAYLYGASLSNKNGAIFADLTDPWNPVYAGHFSSAGYIHDGYVSNDTLYGGHINNGYFSVVDVSDKKNPKLLEVQGTPGSFTHNTWLTDDHRALLTTDEVPDSYLTSYDITDLANITELDRIQVNPGSKSIVHNTHVLNDYAVTSWYTEGAVIVDAHEPQHLVIVGQYDTYNGSQTGFAGAWGVYPYLPSGNLLVSDINNGLFVLTPVYKRAAYLSGMVTDSACGTPVAEVTVNVLGQLNRRTSNFAGQYKTGAAGTGTYTVTFSAPGYQTKSIDVALTEGVFTTLDVVLSIAGGTEVTGTVLTAGSPAGTMVKISNDSLSFSAVADASGSFSFCNIPAATYTLQAGKWGYRSFCQPFVTIDTSNNQLSLSLQKGVFDDFNFNLGWSVSVNPSKPATSGLWEVAIPAETTFGSAVANPGTDSPQDCGLRAFVTGNSGSSASDDDVDGGETILTSPAFSLTDFSDPVLSYYRWFYNGGGGSQVDDTLVVSISNGITEVVVEKVSKNTGVMSAWKRKQVRVKDLIQPTANMRVTFNASDKGNGHIVEAAIDMFEILEGTTSVGETALGAVRVYPNPTSGIIMVELSTEESRNFSVQDVSGRVVSTGRFDGGSNTVNLHVAAGIYFLTVQGLPQVTPVIVRN